MVTPTLPRLGTSSNSARTLLNTSRPILKKPAPFPLALNPLPLSPSFSAVFIAPSVTPPVKSPHAHSTSSPCLFAAFTTHPPNAYDRVPTIVSPSPLALPVWGDRVHPPSIDGFKAVETPNHVPLPESPRWDNNKDPRSPPPSKFQTRNAFHFRKLPKMFARIPTELSKALATYPRSPYPTAPVSPVDFAVSEDYALCVKPTSRRAVSFDEKKLNRGRKRFSSSIGGRSATVLPPPLGKSNPSSIKEHVQTKVKASKKPPPLELESSDHLIENTDIVITICSPATSSAQLYQAFWQSMSFEGTLSQDSSEAIMTSLERGNGPDVDVPPQFISGTRDDVVWSPGLSGKPCVEMKTSSRTCNAASDAMNVAPDLLSPELEVNDDRSLDLRKDSKVVVVASPSSNYAPLQNAYDDSSFARVIQHPSRVYP